VAGVRSSLRSIPPRLRVPLAILAVVEVALLVAANRDISRRTPQQLNGTRGAWRLATLASFVGPLAYFRFGRRR